MWLPYAGDETTAVESAGWQRDPVFMQIRANKGVSGPPCQSGDSRVKWNTAWTVGVAAARIGV
jgi:hypothetical protein